MSVCVRCFALSQMLGVDLCSRIINRIGVRVGSRLAFSFGFGGRRFLRGLRFRCSTLGRGGFFLDICGSFGILFIGALLSIVILTAVLIVTVVVGSGFLLGCSGLAC